MIYPTMKHTLLALIAAAGITGTATAQDAQPEHGAAWFNQQTLALAERAAAGWNAMPGGLLWRRVKGDGTGPAPTLDDTVTVHYAGTLADGTRFDSSYDRGEPATFPLRGLVPAWQMAIPYMGIGDTIEIAAPATLAYGPRGRGPIPGGATLLFTVELLGIEGVAAD